MDRANPEVRGDLADLRDRHHPLRPEDLENGHHLDLANIRDVPLAGPRGPLGTLLALH